MTDGPIRIGIAGTDNSHCAAFAQIINRGRLGEEAFEPLPARVTALCADDDMERGERIASEHDIDAVVDNPAGLIGKVDAAIVVHRAGDLHAPAAVPLLEAGVPVFVDKPFACCEADARRMIEAAHRGKTHVWSCSAVRYAEDYLRFKTEVATRCGPMRAGVVSSPCDRHSPYGGIYFYAIHGVELVLDMFGHDFADPRVLDHDDPLMVQFHYKSGALVTLQLMNDAAYSFHLLAHGAEDVRFLRINPARSFYYDTLLQFMTMVRQQRPLLSDEELLTPVRVLDQIAGALQ